jgi:FkbM family methyltransferase
VAYTLHVSAYRLPTTQGGQYASNRNSPKPIPSGLDCLSCLLAGFNSSCCGHWVAAKSGRWVAARYDFIALEVSAKSVFCLLEILSAILTKPMSNLLDSLITSMVRRGLWGRHRVLKLLKQHNPYYLIQARSKHGILFNLNPEDYLDAIVLKNGYYEEEVLTALLQHIGNEDILWDIGANIGLHAITIKHLRPKTQVVCFEPSPFTFSRLYLNANLNNADLLLINIGLSNSIGYSKLSFTISGNSGLTSFRPWNNFSYQHAMLCYCDTAANMVRHGVIPIPTVIKIDVEGFEFEVLSGLEELLENGMLRVVIFEAPSDFLENSNRYPVHHLLRQTGFEITALPPMNKEVQALPTNFLAKR